MKFDSSLLVLVQLLLLPLSQAQEVPPTTITCGCNDCTADILQNDAGGETCLERIQTRITTLGDEELVACTQVAATYPTSCGPQCHPEKCDGQKPPFCDCWTCTREVWDAEVSGFSCGVRILLNLSINPGPETDACQNVAESYPEPCGPCNPETCPSTPPTGSPTAAPTTATAAPTIQGQTTTQPLETDAPTPVPPEHCGCYECVDFWENDADGFTCRERIQYEQTVAGGGKTQEEACRRQSEIYPYSCGPGCHPDKCDGQQPAYCACPDCTLELLQTQADDFTCVQRIASLRRPSGGNFSEVEACAKVASDYEECNIEACNPSRCRGGIGFDRSATREKNDRKGVPWVWAVLGANALFCIIIFIMYKKW